MNTLQTSTLTGMKTKFDGGQVVITPGIEALLELSTLNVVLLMEALVKHITGDWGMVGHEDWQSNDEALLDGSRLLSAYIVGQTKVWIITEAEGEQGKRAVTTVLLPEEY